MQHKRAIGRGGQVGLGLAEVKQLDRIVHGGMAGIMPLASCPRHAGNYRVAHVGPLQRGLLAALGSPGKLESRTLRV